MNQNDCLINLEELNTEKEKLENFESKKKQTGEFSEKVRKTIVGVCIAGVIIHVLGLLTQSPVLVLSSLLGCMPVVVILGPIQMISDGISEKYAKKAEVSKKKISDYENLLTDSMVELPIFGNQITNIDTQENTSATNESKKFHNKR